jgi:hypothetical protein
MSQTPNPPSQKSLTQNFGHSPEDWYRRTARCDLLQLGDEEVNKDRLYRALDHLLAHSTFDSTTSTYTLYVGQTFNQVQVDYNQTVTGNATFTVNNITYDEKSTIPSTDLLFDVSAVDSDGDSAATSLQVNLQGSTTGATERWRLQREGRLPVR